MDAVSVAFEDPRFQEKVKKEIPNMILKADLEASKYSKSGLIKGSVRKKYLIDFLTNYFGKDNVRITVDIPDIDMQIDSLSIKIRTITGKSGVKIKWTIDREKVEEFLINYKPLCGILFLRKKRVTDKIEYPCGLFWIPLETQEKIFNKVGLKKYLVPPRPDTNARGIELSKIALKLLLKDDKTKHIDIIWM